MATPLGKVFSTDEKAIAQADLKLLGSTVESLVVEFDQERFEQLFSSGSISSKVSSKTCSQVSSQTSHRKAHKPFDKAVAQPLLRV